MPLAATCRAMCRSRIGTLRLPVAKARSRAEPQGSISPACDIRKVAEAVSTARLRLDKVELAGNVSGDINSSWSGSPEKAVSSFKLEVNPPANPTTKEVPVTAQLQATYHGDIRTLDVAGLNLATRAIRVSATGGLGSDKAQARVSLNATDLHELQPALDALAPGTRIPVSLEGRSSFNGAIFGKLDALSARGHLDLEKFDTEFRLAASSAARARGCARPLTPASLGRALRRPELHAFIGVSAARNVAPGRCAAWLFRQHHAAPGLLRREDQPAQRHASCPK